ncbi:hypothetical protein BLNAU_10376 [Blattamonas nauphoetae]|uniref:Telomere length regulation protein conserved domain-containing protein n=1 Tax=Blattamonas nauphoetae TaxID=2049346 RepID=A0ABQ9XTB2_9EUKA|nr:hypothetical protein BLNAU_10376 [Blattamonas nauphoetae]
MENQNSNTDTKTKILTLIAALGSSQGLLDDAELTPVKHRLFLESKSLFVCDPNDQTIHQPILSLLRQISINSQIDLVEAGFLAQTIFFNSTSPSTIFDALFVLCELPIKHESLILSTLHQFHADRTFSIVTSAITAKSSLALFRFVLFLFIVTNRCVNHLSPKSPSLIPILRLLFWSDLDTFNSMDEHEQQEYHSTLESVDVASTFLKVCSTVFRYRAGLDGADTGTFGGIMCETENLLLRLIATILNTSTDQSILPRGITGPLVVPLLNTCALFRGRNDNLQRLLWDVKEMWPANQSLPDWQIESQTELGIELFGASENRLSVIGSEILGGNTGPHPDADVDWSWLWKTHDERAGPGHHAGLARSMIISLLTLVEDPSQLSLSLLSGGLRPWDSRKPVSEIFMEGSVMNEATLDELVSAMFKENEMAEKETVVMEQVVLRELKGTDDMLLNENQSDTDDPPSQPIEIKKKGRGANPKGRKQTPTTKRKRGGRTDTEEGAPTVLDEIEDIVSDDFGGFDVNEWPSTSDRPLTNRDITQARAKLHGVMSKCFNHVTGEYSGRDVLCLFGWTWAALIHHGDALLSDEGLKEARLLCANTIVMICVEWIEKCLEEEKLGREAEEREKITQAVIRKNSHLFSTNDTPPSSLFFTSPSSVVSFTQRIAPQSQKQTRLPLPDIPTRQKIRFLFRLLPPNLVSVVSECVVANCGYNVRITAIYVRQLLGI